MTRQPTHVSLAAIGLIVASAACFTAIDAIVKYLGLRYSAPLLVWARWGVPAVLVVALLGPKLCLGLLRTPNLKLHVVRGAVLMVSSLCFFSALKVLPLADATGLNYSTPILVMLMAGWFLRERITWPRWLFVLVGFVGMLLIVRPGSAMLQAASLFALGAAALNATFQILTRKLAREDLMALIFYPSLVGAVLMSLAVPFFYDEFSYLTSLDALLFITIGIIGLLGHFLYIQAFQRATASTIAPFTYMQLVWATLAGWLAFGAFPDGWVLAGMIVIAASALMLTWHERRHARRNSSEPRAGDWLQSPMMMSVPGADRTEITLDATPAGLAAEVFQLGIGQSTIISSGKGPPKTVIRTD
ncbi:MAG: DMT family transporter [Casimicrobiaceae bacterium]